MNKQYKKIIELLKKTNYFNFNNICKDENGNICVCTYSNCLIVQPMTAAAKRKILLNPYTRTLSSTKHYFALYWFPQDIAGEGRDKLPLKYKTRLYNLLRAKEFGQIRILRALILPPNEILKLKFTAKSYEKRKDRDYKDDLEDTSCKQLAQEPKTYATINKVSLTYNTLLILKNAKENKNKSLYYYRDAKTFYTYCIINYILEHSQIISPENLKYPNPIAEVHMPAKEFQKLFPSRATLEAPEGVEIHYSGSSERLSKNSSVTLKFSENFLKTYKNIIQRSEENVEVPLSFIKVPMFFVLEALRKENLGANGFKFFLWFLTFYRIKSPTIYHSLKTIMTETGMDTKHGYKKPLALLQKYFDYLRRVNILIEVYEPLKFNKKNIDEPPKYEGHLIKLKKPKK